MIIMGLFLLAAAAVVAVELVVANDDAQITVNMWRWSWTADSSWLAVAGAAILAAALLGLLMLKAGGKRERRLRRERRQLARENRQLAQRAEMAQPTDAERFRDVPGRGYDGPPQSYAGPARGYGAPAGTTTALPREPSTPGRPKETSARAPEEGRHVDR